MRDTSQYSVQAIRGKYFWVPFWLAVATGTGIAGYYLGLHAANEAAGEKDVAALAIAAMRSPIDGIQYAENRLLSDKIGYEVYRGVIRAGLKKPDIETLEAVFESLTHVIASGDANQRDTQKMIDQMKPIVLLALSEDSEHTAGLNKEFRAFGMDTVIASHKDESKDNAVICYKDETCITSAKRVKEILANRGFQVGDVVQITKTTAVYDKRIDVLLASVPKGKKDEKAKR